MFGVQCSAFGVWCSLFCVFLLPSDFRLFPFVFCLVAGCWLLVAGCLVFDCLLFSDLELGFLLFTHLFSSLTVSFSHFRFVAPSSGFFSEGRSLVLRRFLTAGAQSFPQSSKGQAFVFGVQCSVFCVWCFLLPFAFCLSSFSFCLLSCSWLLVAGCLLFIVCCSRFRAWHFSLFTFHFHSFFSSLTVSLFTFHFHSFFSPLTISPSHFLSVASSFRHFVARLFRKAVS